jgi:hypothetical protein
LYAVLAARIEDAGGHHLQAEEAGAAVAEDRGRHLREHAALHLAVSELEELLLGVLE